LHSVQHRLVEETGEKIADFSDPNFPLAAKFGKEADFLLAFLEVAGYNVWVERRF